MQFLPKLIWGNKEDYDVVKVNTQNYSSRTVEAADGNLDAWREVFEFAQAGFDSNKNYYAIQGLDENGKVDSSLNVLVDIDNLIDYMLVIFYAGNFDAPYSKFGDFINNFYNLRNRQVRQQGFSFFFYDAEHSLLAHPDGPGIRPEENRVDVNMNVSTINDFNSQWLHYRLTSNLEYRQRFADRAYKYLYNNGVLTTDRCRKLFMDTANEIDMAIIAESARWGDAKRAVPFTKENWITAVNDVANLFINQRTNILIGQLKAAGLLPALTPPIFKKDGDVIINQVVDYKKDFVLDMNNPNSSGTVYYTTDGSDPRCAGGTVSSIAVNGSNANPLHVVSSIKIKARVNNGNEWSALHELSVLKNDVDFTGLKITEIHYFPPDKGAISGKDLEFFELKNTGNQNLIISGINIADGITYQFPYNTILNSGDFVVLSSNKNLFEYYYGLVSTGEFKGHLSNSGETVLITSGDSQLISAVNFGVFNPWPETTRGTGKSLVPTQPNSTSNPNNFGYWRASNKIDGSPFAVDQVALNSNLLTEFADINIFPNPVTTYLFIDINAANAGDVKIDLYTSSSSLITQIDGYVIAGNRNRFVLDFGAYNLLNGLYILTINTPDNSINNKIIYKR